MTTKWSFQIRLDKVRVNIIEELIMGAKRPKEIKALKEIPSDRDKFKLLNQMIKEGILTKEKLSSKHTIYKLKIDESIVKKMIEEDVNREDMLKEALKEIKAKDSSLSEEDAIRGRVGIILTEITNFLNAFESTIRAPPEYQLLTTWLFDRFLVRFEKYLTTFGTLNPTTTDKALENVKNLINEEASRLNFASYTSQT